MELKNDVVIKSPIEDVWDAFNDVERIAPCLPGAQLQEIEGDEHRGVVKVKVGPITAQYKGKAVFVEQNKDDWRVVIDGQGRDARGAGNASALITAQLEPIGDDSTRLSVTTDLKLTGKVASFGGRSGVMEEVSGKLMGQFAENFEAMMAESAAGGTVEPERVASAAQAGAVRRIDMPEPQAVDLLGTAGTPIVKRLAPIAAVLLVLWLLRRVLGGRHD
ncbi:MAG: SRPBCC family protein [Acidimicrobiia bacterium]|nr:SRPBCC family protein [Acidimicrobiia bacterium]